MPAVRVNEVVRNLNVFLCKETKALGFFFCTGTIGTPVCCDDDMTLQTATRSCMIIKTDVLLSKGKMPQPLCIYIYMFLPPNT